MAKEVMRIRLKSLSDLQRQQARLYRECRTGILEPSIMTAMSQLLKRLHDMMISERESEVADAVLDMEERLTRLQEKRG